ncbi:uncharacterized protein LOC127707515 isoform X2 [Mytilus californianus]|uniref:uncharacterized protein LOC127707515 isoform X2 n=1 Tax=Mytilus californianus TaxID=6549 RepID=UPI002247E237|nr:uncharacterized protein LOC127707515 isoform X2 [Mytilus californianus]
MYAYIGCFEDRKIRLLHDGPYKATNNIMSTNICFNHCNSNNYEYFATEYGHECFCGNGGKLGSDQYPTKMEKDCNMACIGHVTQTCGGTWRASVYKINRNGQTVSTTTHTPTSQKQRTSDIGHQLSTTKYTPPSPKTSNSDIGIGIGMTIVLLLIIVAVISCLFWKRRKQKAHTKESSMSDHEYDRNQNITTSDSSSIELNVYENGHTYGNSNSNNTTQISNGCIKPQTCKTNAKHMHSKPETDPEHVHDKLDKRSILKNMLPSLLYNYFKLDNDKFDKVNGNHIADVSQTEVDLTAAGSNGAYATLDSTATGFKKGKPVFPRNKQNIDQTKLEKKKHVTKGEGDYCCVEGEYNKLNQIRRFSNNGNLYSHAVDGVYDISGINNQPTENTYDHFLGCQTVIAADYDNVMKY